MATSKKARTAKPAEDVNVPVKVRMDPSSDTFTIYCNHFEINHSLHEFSVVAGRAPGRVSKVELEAARNSGQLNVVPDAQLLIPPTVLPRLIEALQKQQALYEQKHGAIKPPKEPKV